MSGPADPADPGTEAEAAAPLPADGLILLPVRDVVLFPGVVVPLRISRPRSVAGIQRAVAEERPVGLVLQRAPEADEPGAEGLHRIGCRAAILRYITAPDGQHHVILQGIERFRLIEVLRDAPVLAARVQPLPEPRARSAEIEGRFLYLREQAAEALELVPDAPEELIASIRAMEAPGALADVATAYADIPAAEKQAVLETLDIAARVERVSKILARRIEVLKISREIGRQTRAAFDERQREAVLREQMATIRRQLGDDGEDPRAAEVAELSEAIAGAGMPEPVEAQVRKELRRYEHLPEAAAEAGMLRTWLDWMVELPWRLPEAPPIDLARARAILDADHEGLDKVKARIVEFLAVRKLAPGGRAPILCFAGPPGVGKTSLGRSIARALEKPFARVSLGGVHDEAEIRGHRRTYVGALPGAVIQAVRRAGDRGCVMMLDEIDKVGRGVQGDPAAALLEVLDPEQNATFRDNYLGVEFDLSHVVFLTTANQLDTIPGPLRDRMEVIRIAGYTQEEKLAIARRHLLPRQLEATGLRPGQVELTEAALAELVRGYTREAGVRALEREIGAVLRHAAVRIAEAGAGSERIDAADLERILGPARFEGEVAMRTSLPGVATGLAWTPVGGDILFVEASRAPGKGGLILTGQLGEVMRESARAALSLVRARAADLGIGPRVIERSDIHVHVPAGATPKDGPSAGVAIYVALASLLLDRRVRSDTAMTGEISLRGLVLPVGGIKEKVLAAAAAGIGRVLLPARNRRDLDEIPQGARERLEIVWLDDVDQALRAALEPEPAAQAEAAWPADARAP